VIFRNRKTSSPHRSDQEFLPAALEILETPPAPLQTVFLLTICAFAVVALVWTYFSKIDVIAVAQGKIQPSGRVKVVQPVETGKVTAVYVSNGRHVRKDDVLVELEAEDAVADQIGSQVDHAAAQAEMIRRSTALRSVRTHALLPMPSVAWPGDIPKAIQIREERVLTGDLAQLHSQITSLAAQRAQKEAERDRLLATIKAQETLIATLQERVEMRQTLVSRGAGSRGSVLDALQELQLQQTSLTGQVGQEKESEANIVVLSDEIAKAFETFIAENTQKLAEAEKQADSTEGKLIKARVRTGHVTLKSPIDGMVQALSISTVGQVITTGEEVMRIVPDGSALEIECYLLNKDIGFVRPGQEAIAKIESFPFTRFGSIDATVLKVAHDAIPEPDAQQIEGDPSKSTRSLGFAGTERLQNLVFPVTLSPQSSKMTVDGIAIPLSPGMTVSVEIKTGQRRILEYLFSPLVEVAAKAMKER